MEKLAEIFFHLQVNIVNCVIIVSFVVNCTRLTVHRRSSRR